MPRVGVPVPEVSSWMARAMASESDWVSGRLGFWARVALMPGPESATTMSRLLPRRWGITRTWQWAPASSDTSAASEYDCLVP